ncbi:MAG: sulfotransferase family protein [Actinomycetota bacterium]
MNGGRNAGPEQGPNETLERRRRWPNLFIVGAVKAGTTSLYRYLDDHPDIYMSPVKEPDFFTHEGADPDAYLGLFEGASGEKLLGEATPWYLARPGTAERIRNVSPDAKILIMLRDPVSRAYSQYLMDVRNGRQTAELWEAVQKDHRLPEHGYVSLGSYCEQVSRYLEVFGDQVLVAFFEDFVRDPRGSLERVLHFLGVDPGRARNIDLGVHNSYRRLRGVWGRPAWNAYRNKRIRSVAQRLFPPRVRERAHGFIFSGKKPPMDPRAHRFLQHVYRDEAACLRRLLGRGVPWGNGLIRSERSGSAKMVWAEEPNAPSKDDRGGL